MWKLTKLSSRNLSPEGIRTNEIIGKLGSVLSLQKPILLWAEPLDPLVGNIRMFKSSSIKKIDPLENRKNNQEAIYHTENSSYRLENLNSHLYDPLTTLYWKDELLNGILNAIVDFGCLSEHELIVKLINEYGLHEKDFVNLYNNRFSFRKNDIEIYKYFELIECEYCKEFTDSSESYFYTNVYDITADGLMFLELQQGN